MQAHERRTPESRGARVIRRVLVPGVLVALGVAAGWLPGMIGVGAALAAILGLPAWGLSLLDGDRTGEGGEAPSVALAGIVAGLGVACVALWWASLFAPLGRWRILAVVAAVAGLLRLVTQGVSRSRSAVGPGGQGGQSGSGGASRRPLRLVAAASLVFAALVLAPFLVHGTVTGDSVRKVGMTDWYKHVVVTSSLAAHEAHPVVNPFVAGEEPFVYYYGFHLVAAAAHELAGRGENVFGTLLLLTLVVAACSPWVLFRFARQLGLESWPAAWVAAAGVLLAGFDVGILLVDTARNLATAGVPDLDFEGLRALVPSTHPNYWIHHDQRQFNAPYTATIWAPQHWTAALLAVVAIGALAGRRRDDRRARTVLVAGLGLAALPAVSTYVAVSVAAALLVAGVVALVRWRRAGDTAFDVVVWALAALVALVASWPVLARLAVGAERQLRIAVSAAPSPWHGGLFTGLLGDGTATRLLDTPLLLLLQLGLVGLLGLVGVVGALSGRRWASDALRLVAPMPLVVILAAVLVRPPPGPNNFFARPMLVAWCLLVPFAVLQWQRRGRGVGWRLLLAICALGVVYGAVGATAEGTFFRPAAAARVAVADGVRSQSPEEARVAIDPRHYSSDFGYWLERDFVLADSRHAVLFGARPQAVEEIAARLRRAYDAPSGAVAARRFAALGADVVLVKGGAVWQDSGCFAAGPKAGDWQAFTLRTVDC